MKKLLALAAAAVCVSPALAQYTAGPFAGPFTVPINGQFQSIDLSGPAVPPASYGFVQIRADYSFDTPSNQFQNDIRAALTSAAVNGVTTIPGTTTRYYSNFSTGGAAPTSALASNTPGTILWDANMDSAFVADGVKPLFLAFRTSWTSGQPVKLSNLTVTLSTAAPSIPNETCATATDITPNLATALTGPGTSTVLPSVLMVGGSGAPVAQPTFGCSAAAVTRTVWYKFQPPASAPYRFQTCTSSGTINNVTNNIIGIFEYNPADPCGALTQVSCSTLTCTGGALAIPVELDAAKSYYVVVGRTGTTALGSAEKRYQLRADRVASLPVCTTSETEPNDSKAASNIVTLNAGEVICGNSTGTDTLTPGLTSADFFKVKANIAAGPARIVRHQMRPFTFTGTNNVEILGIGQTGGVATPATLSVLQNTSFLPVAITDKHVQFYTLGNPAAADDANVYVRVTGVPQAVTDYRVQMTSSDVTPVDLARTLRPGTITINTVGQTGGTQTDTDMIILDSDFKVFSNFLNDDAPSPSTSLGSTLTRTFAAGTYYLAIAEYNVATSITSPTDDRWRGAPLSDFGGVMARGDAAPNATPTNVSFKITDTDGDVATAVNTVGPWDIAFFKIVVAPATSAGCNPADIACDDGTPLVSAPGCTNSTTGPNEGDYNAFFAADGFFFQAGQGLAGVGGFCDIACDDGEPLGPNPGCSNGGVNEGDYNCFFNNLFLSCI